MIRSFRHKGLRRFFETGEGSGLSAELRPKLRRQLTLLDESSLPKDMDLPGYRLHQLKGRRTGEWAIWVSANWRLVFTFDAGDVVDVDFLDYH